MNATDSWDRTPLHWAAYNGHTEVAQVLYDAGAHVMAKTKGGSTPYAMVRRAPSGTKCVVRRCEQWY